MIRRILLFICVFVNIVSATNNVVDKTQEQPKILGLVDVIDIALKNNPKVKEQYLNVEIGEKNYGIGKSDWYPKINGNVGTSKGKVKYKNDRTPLTNTVKTKGWSADVGLNYLLFDFGSREANILSLAYKLDMLSYQTNLYVQNFIYNVISSYYNLLSAIANLEASQEMELSSKEAFNAAKTRYGLGVVALTDKLQAETSYHQSVLTVEQAENNVKITKAQLNYLLNLSPDYDLKLSVPILDTSSDLFSKDVKELIAFALKNRADLKSIDAEKESYKKEVWKTQAQRLPSINLNGSYGVSTDQMDRMNNNTNWNVGITASMPFFTGGALVDTVAKSKLNLQIAENKKDDAIKNAELDVWSAYQNFTTAKNTFQTSGVLLRSATETERNIFGRYKNGKSSILDLLNAQANLSNARYGYISSQYNWFIQRANLIRALGIMNLDEVKKVTNINMEDVYVE